MTTTIHEHSNIINHYDCNSGKNIKNNKNIIIKNINQSNVDNSNIKNSSISVSPSSSSSVNSYSGCGRLQTSSSASASSFTSQASGHINKTHRKSKSDVASVANDDDISCYSSNQSGIICMSNETLNRDSLTIISNRDESINNKVDDDDVSSLKSLSSSIHSFSNDDNLDITDNLNNPKNVSLLMEHQICDERNLFTKKLKNSDNIQIPPTSDKYQSSGSSSSKCNNKIRSNNSSSSHDDDNDLVYCKKCNCSKLTSHDDTEKISIEETVKQGHCSCCRCCSTCTKCSCCCCCCSNSLYICNCSNCCCCCCSTTNYIEDKTIKHSTPHSHYHQKSIKQKSTNPSHDNNIKSIL